MATFPLGLLAGPQVPQVPGTPQVIQGPNGPMVIPANPGGAGGILGGGSVWGGNNISQNMPTDRYSEAARLRGGAPFTADALGTAVGNAFSTVTGFGMSNPIQMGIRAAKAAIMGEPIAQAAFGVHDIPGQFAITSKKPIRNLTDLHAAMAESRQRAQAAINAARSGTSFAGGTGNTSVAGGRSVGGLAVGNDGRIAGGI